MLILMLISAVEFGQILSLTQIVNVDVGSNFICRILHHYGFHIRGFVPQMTVNIYNNSISISKECATKIIAVGTDMYRLQL